MIKNNYNKDLSFNTYKNYVNNNRLYDNDNQIKQYNNF